MALPEKTIPISDFEKVIHERARLHKEVDEARDFVRYAESGILSAKTRLQECKQDFERILKKLHDNQKLGGFEPSDCYHCGLRSDSWRGGYFPFCDLHDCFAVDYSPCPCKDFKETTVKFTD